MTDFNEFLKKRQEELAREKENQHKESIQETGKMGNSIIGFLIGAGVFCVIGFILILIYNEAFADKVYITHNKYEYKQAHLYMPFLVIFSVLGGFLGARILYRS